MQEIDLQRATSASENVRAVMGTSARQVSIRVPDPGPSTATAHLGTAKVVIKARLEKRSLKVASMVWVAGLVCLG